MNYYPHHIGDFNNATRHLTRIERSIYRDLIELYYDTEKPVTRDITSLCRRVLARTDEEAAAVTSVLREFFTETQEGWFHDRCDEEICKAIELREDGKGRKENERERQRRHRERRKLLFSRLREIGIVPPWDTSTEALQKMLDGKTSQSRHEPVTRDVTANQEPLPITQVPKETKTKPRAAGADVFPEITDRQLVEDWLKVRKVKKLATTDTAMEGFKREVERSGFSLESILRKCCEKGWGGFEAKWLENDYGPPKRAEKFDPIAYVNRYAKKPSEYDEKVIEH